MADMCNDNRFVLIEKYKQKLIEATNISDRQEEMGVIDSILFRFWQMGWLDKLEQPEQKWIPCSERLPKKSGDYLVTISFDISGEPVKEVYKNYFSVLSQKWLYYGEYVKAWIPLPESYKGENE